MVSLISVLNKYVQTREYFNYILIKYPSYYLLKI